MTQAFSVTDQVTVCLFEPLTEAVQRIVRESVNFEERPWQGPSFAVDYHDAAALTDDHIAEGSLVMTRH